MAAPTFVAAITLNATADTSVTLTMPAHNAGDTGIVFVWCRDATQNTFTADNGWTQLDPPGEWYATEANENSYAIFKKENLSGSEANPTFSSNVDTSNIYAAGVIYRGDGDVAEVRVVGTQATASSEPLTIPGITTLDADTLVVACYQYGDDNGSAVTFSGGGLTWTPDSYQETTLGADGCFAFGSAPKASAGATGDITADLNAAFTSGKQNNGVLLALAVPASGTTYNQSVGGAITPAGALIKVTTKVVAGASTPAGALVKQTSRALSGAITPAGALVKSLSRALAGAITPGAGALETAKLRLESVSGAISPAGAMVKQTSKVLAGALSPAGALAKSTSRALIGAITPAGALTGVKVAVKTVDGVVTLSGVVVLQTVKVLTGAVTPTGAIARTIGRALAGAITPTGVVVAARTFLQTLTGAITPSGDTQGTHEPGAPAAPPGGVLTRFTRVADETDHA